ncbi:DUF3298 and DUF4163 domain-containing protein [Winogradskyella algicola]|uniref:DUF3298 and DUF4163 domain-containing protein n=1 Tax=Winogradskyella algicola TaxID=2575815 RepID=UPI00110980A7|nr:DUF3298 and DUF4163 domain-containing protein [Winogradskyella algicola]
MINKNHISLLFLYLTLFFSCSNETKTISFENNSYENHYEADISVSIDEAIGNSEVSKIINFKIKEAIISTLSDVTKKTSLESVLEDFDAEFITFKKQFPEASHPAWELHIETEKVYQSEEIITLSINTYEFKGGAHGNDKIKFLNLNANTGEVYNLSDIVNNSDGFKALAKDHFLKSIDVDKENNQIEDYFFGKTFQLPENIGFSDDGLVFLYNVYEVASYDQGYTEFVIPFDAVESYLKVE